MRNRSSSEDYEQQFKIALVYGRAVGKERPAIDYDQLEYDGANPHSGFFLLLLGRYRGGWS
jgi:hypothetical protein